MAKPKLSIKVKFVFITICRPWWTADILGRACQEGLLETISAALQGVFSMTEECTDNVCGNLSFQQGRIGCTRERWM